MLTIKTTRGAPHSRAPRQGSGAGRGLESKKGSRCGHEPGPPPSRLLGLGRGGLGIEIVALVLGSLDLGCLDLLRLSLSLSPFLNVPCLDLDLQPLVLVQRDVTLESAFAVTLGKGEPEQGRLQSRR